MTEIRDLGSPNVERFRSRAVIVAGIAIVLAILGFFLNRDQFFRSYLLAYTFWIGLTLGSLGLLMIQHMTGGAWGFVTRRNTEAASRLFPLMLGLFVPVLIGMKRLYIWTDPSLWTAEQHEVIE